MGRLKVWIWNLRFTLGYRIGGFTSAQRERPPLWAARTVSINPEE